MSCIHTSEELAYNEMCIVYPCNIVRNEQAVLTAPMLSIFFTMLMHLFKINNLRSFKSNYIISFQVIKHNHHESRRMQRMNIMSFS